MRRAQAGSKGALAPGCSAQTHSRGCTCRRMHLLMQATMQTTGRGWVRQDGSGPAPRSGLTATNRSPNRLSRERCRSFGHAARRHHKGATGEVSEVAASRGCGIAATETNAGACARSRRFSVDALRGRRAAEKTHSRRDALPERRVPGKQRSSSGMSATLIGGSSEAFGLPRTSEFECQPEIGFNG